MKTESASSTRQRLADIRDTLANIQTDYEVGRLTIVEAKNAIELAKAEVVRIGDERDTLAYWVGDVISRLEYQERYTVYPPTHATNGGPRVKR